MNQVHQVKIQYNNIDESQIIGEFIQYEKALDRFQTMLCFFKMPHVLRYEPGKKKEYEFYFHGMTLQLNTIKKHTHLK